MKGTSVHQIRIDEKIFIVNRSIPHYFGSASVSGFFGFLKFFSFIFLLENIKFITGINENFQFDIIDISISITGFIFNFLITIIYSYQKHEGRPKQVENKSEPPIEEVYEKEFLNGKSIAIELKDEQGQIQIFAGSDKTKFFKIPRPEGVPVTPPPTPKSIAPKNADNSHP